MTEIQEPTPQQLFGFNPFDPEFRKNPYPVYQQLLEEAPVVHSPFGLWVLSRHADCVEVLHDHVRMASDMRKSAQYQLAVQNGAIDLPEDVTPSFLFLDPPDHTRLRGLVTKAFTPRTIEELRPFVESFVDDVIDRALERGSMEVIEDLAYPLPVTVICRMLGVPTEDHVRFRDWSREAARSLDPEIALPPEAIEQRRKVQQAFLEYFTELVATRRASPGNDLLSELIAVEEAGDTLSTQELITTAILLLIAGHETTVNLIGNGVLQLLRHPDELARLRADPALMRTAVEEILRFDPPVQFNGRLAVEDVDVGGTTIPAGEQVLTLIGAANRDPAAFSDPLRFDVSRKPNPHIAFSMGPHFCLGAPLARLEGQIALGALARRLPKIELADPDPPYKENIVLRGLAELRVSV